MRRAASKTHANRGQSWELVVEMLHNLYEQRGRAVCIRLPPPMRILGSAGKGVFRAVFASNGPPDWLVMADGSTFLLECKSHKADRWPLSQLHEHQAARFVDIEERTEHGHGLLLLQHGASGTSWLIPWVLLAPRWSEAKEGAARGRASLTLEEIEAMAICGGRGVVDYLGPALEWAGRMG